MKTTALLLAALTASFCFATALARTPVPAPPPTAPQNAIFQPDRDIPFQSRSRPPAPDETFNPRLPMARATNRDPNAGGDDVPVAEPQLLAVQSDLAVDSEGRFYLVNMVTNDHLITRLEIRRSTDHGHTWSLWATLADPAEVSKFQYPSLHIAEGMEDRLFLSYSSFDAYQSSIHVAWTPLADTPTWSEVLIEEIPTGALYQTSLTSDVAGFSEYYLYLVYTYQNQEESQIRFARSTDMGKTFEDPYAIASLALEDRQYSFPHVSYGYGRYVHVAWEFSIQSDVYDDALRARRAPSFANGGQADWDPILAVTSATDGIDDHCKMITASTYTPQILCGYDRHDSGGVLISSALSQSTDQGEIWNTSVPLDDDMKYLSDIIQSPEDSRWNVCVSRADETGYLPVPAADISAFAEYQSLSATPLCGRVQMVMDPSHENRFALTWALADEFDSFHQYYFDAEFRADPGYPNLEDGFPVPLEAQPISDPALADLDADGQLEIIFGDSYGFVRVYRADGSVFPGWPVYCGTSLSDSPIAVADMNGDGTPTILAPSADGRVFGYNPDGSTTPGWPFDSGEDAYASVNVGHLGPPYPYVAVVIAGSKMHFLNYQGRQVPGSSVWNNDSFARGCAIGDHDNDGINEVVFRAGSLLLGAEMLMTYTDLYFPLGATGETTPALGDLDLDGDLEIVVTTPGQVHVIGDGGTYHPGWPRAFDPGFQLSDPAIAHIWASFDPEIAVCSRNWKANLFQEDGEPVPGYPVESDLWYIHGNPVMGAVGLSPAVVFGARGSKGWAFRNNGDLVEGWPRALDTHCQLTPAIADIDLDGRNEVVFLTLDELVVVDVNTEPWAERHNWPMTGHDARRSGCSDCPDDLLSPAPDDPEAVTRVSFAAPTPNPVSGRATFLYAVPLRAVVELAIYDLRGRRVALVKREEVVPGNHQIAWNGRGDDGRQLASGNYVAALRVRGPGVNEQLNRKVTILR